MLGKRKLALIKSFALGCSRKWKRRKKSKLRADEDSWKDIPLEASEVDSGIDTWTTRRQTAQSLARTTAVAAVPTSAIALPESLPHVHACPGIASLSSDDPVLSPARQGVSATESASAGSASSCRRRSRRRGVRARKVSPLAPLTPSATTAAVSSTVPVRPSVTQGTGSSSVASVTAELDITTEIAETPAQTVSSTKSTPPTSWTHVQTEATTTTTTQPPCTDTPSHTTPSNNAAIPTMDSELLSKARKRDRKRGRKRAARRERRVGPRSLDELSPEWRDGINLTKAPLCNSSRPAEPSPAFNQPVECSVPNFSGHKSAPDAKGADEDGSTTTRASSEMDVLDAPPKAYRVSWVCSKRSKKKFMHLTTYRYGSVVDPERKPIGTGSVPTTGILRKSR